MIHVLVVDDSRSIRHGLVELLERDPEVTVVGTAENGLEAVELVKRLRPDVVTMDYEMPLLDGIEATRRIMREQPVPVVMVSAVLDPEQAAANFSALEAGALTILRKPRLIGAGCEEERSRLVETVKLMSEVRVVRRHSRMTQPLVPPRLPVVVSDEPATYKAVLIGASTGGPLALQQILEALPANYPLPILAVQHITPGFLPGMVHWLNQSCRLEVLVAKKLEQVLPGRVYFAPDDHHMSLSKDMYIRLSADPPMGGLRPAVGHMFRRASEEWGPELMAVLLTGMGRDGARELGWMRAKGAMTIAQDKASSTVWGMPGEAVALNAAVKVLPLERIPNVLMDLAGLGGTPLEDRK